ncbi:bifunctional metallophosphatase/5'-nucleotidase [Nocardioides insulae]|uniref:bifunctional metallophosphatase/5'-nucleotidase n=1 Tax=Nocardioides insulae TaxID=394734 RepID=UPI0004200139|nr:bifunctional UDP-sugar hydrolase/5'-nucleotidase [Nocardioides insulae]
MISARHSLIGALASVLVTAPLAVGAVAGPAHAEAVPIRLLDINDFHGRIDANTTAFATTVEQQRAEAGEANTLFLSAGDNIGASLFASAVQEDQPTIDVLNALGLTASAVGNHEFDKGVEDLTGRVGAAADWSYLGANVYQAGTTTPVLDAYTTREIGGLTVGVIGAVTQETPSLVSPDGVAGLEFGDPVEAVNRVAAELSDGEDANGEADVIVAEYHDGASAGTPEEATLEDEVAAGGAFAQIVNDTAPEVDVIFTGHTHKQYAWDAPLPGGGTRPVVQTGSYGEFVGQVDITVDSESGEVTAYAASNVPRAAQADTSLPRVAEVDGIVKAALAHADEVGSQPVGEITDDITTAFNAGVRDDRSAESTLGGLVADALREGVSDIADVDLGITNPGGLRDELLYAGDTAENPANTDGVVTYAEANQVLPFNNTVSLGQLTGAQIVSVLEQQWQPAGVARPYLQLGLSQNVSVTADAGAPAGERITSVRVDGEPLDPARSYTVSTLSFLSAGGDNFTAFQEGEWTDTGLLDAELWRDYLAANSPVSPDFARRQVFTSGLPAELPAGGPSTFVLGPDAESPSQPFTGETLDLTSLGAPFNTSLTATGTGAAGQLLELGSFPVEAGTAEVSLDVPAELAGGEIQLVAEPSGTAVTVPVGAAALEPATIRALALPVKQGRTGRVVAHVRGPEPTLRGTVELRDDARVLDRARLRGPAAVLRFDTRGWKPGRHRLTVAYAGDEHTGPAERSVTVWVLPGHGQS